MLRLNSHYLMQIMLPKEKVSDWGYFRDFLYCHMQVVFNGASCATSCTFLLEFLKSQHLADQSGIAVAVNESVIPKKQWSEYKIKENDTIIVITATQGG